MNALTLVILFLLTICLISFGIWKIAKINLHRQRVNALEHEAEITVLGEKALYCYRVGKYEHRIKLADDTFHIVDVDEIKFK